MTTHGSCQREATEWNLVLVSTSGSNMLLSHDEISSRCSDVIFVLSSKNPRGHKLYSKKDKIPEMQLQLNTRFSSICLLVTKGYGTALSIFA